MMAAFFLSNNDDPFINLAIEDSILRQMDTSGPVLLCYINRPSVVIGRFQNPWIEMNWPMMQEEGVEFVRRQSGGGTVYHDAGNLNFCFIHSGRETKKEWNHQVICRALSEFGLDVRPNLRGDLLLEDKKISGSAFKQTKDASFHHGTLLLKSDLQKLKRALIPTLSGVESKSIHSVRSTVTSLSMARPDLTANEIFEALRKSFSLEIEQELKVEVPILGPEILEKARWWGSWEWRWGETPKFSWSGHQVEKGLLTDGRAFDQFYQLL